MFLNIPLLAFFPFSVQSTCGNIPGTFPLYSSIEIELKEDILVNGNNTSSGKYFPDVTIDTNGIINTNVSQNLPDLAPTSFPSNSSNFDLDITFTTTINQNSDFFYNDIKIKKAKSSVNFTGGGPFHIKELKVDEKEVILNFDAGIYYIEEFKIGEKDVSINVNSSPVIFHIGKEFIIDGENVSINASKNVDDFIIYLHSKAKFESNEKNLNFTGLIYGPNNVDEVKIEGEDSSIKGAIIISGGNLEIEEKNNTITYTNADQTAISNISTCSGGGGDTPATAFNCVENGADGISGKLYTKTTTQSFSLDVIALQDASTIETNFASGADHTVTVELVDTSSGRSCSAYTALSPAVSQSLLFTSSDSGIKASVTMTSSTAYRTLKCRVTDATDSPSIVGCSTDSFAIRPTSLAISSNLTNTGASGIPIAKSGANFTLTATTSAGYGGTPVINNSNIQAHSGAVQTGSLSGLFAAANSATGISTGAAFSYSEVGSFLFSAYGIYDDSFTLVDQSSDCSDDFSNTVDANGKVGCKFGNTSNSSYFGRFTPDHFDVSLNTPVFSPSCGTFTYFGQPFKYATTPVVTVTAKNASGTTTQNYTGDFWKISSASLTPSYTEATYVLNVLDSSVPQVVDSGNGLGTLTYADTSNNILALTKGVLSAPYDAEIALSFNLSDTDSIVVANINGSAQTNPVKFGAASSGNGMSFIGANKAQRWGRAVLTNSHGSELHPLSIPVATEYYNGTALVKNTADNCTNFILANDFSISDAADNNCMFSSQNTPVVLGSGSVKANLNNSTVSSGSTELVISDNITTSNGPGAGNTGYIDVTSNLSNLSWLLYDWDANGTHNNCPNARATFGIYKGNSRQIYFREVY